MTYLRYWRLARYWYVKIKSCKFRFHGLQSSRSNIIDLWWIFVVKSMTILLFQIRTFFAIDFTVPEGLQRFFSADHLRCCCMPVRTEQYYQRSFGILSTILETTTAGKINYDIITLKTSVVNAYFGHGIRWKCFLDGLSLTHGYGSTIHVVFSNRGIFGTKFRVATLRYGNLHYIQ